MLDKPGYTSALLFIAAATAAPAQTLTTLVSFSGANGAAPQHMALIQGTDGNLWGTTGQGGSHGLGTIFNVSPAGIFTTLHSFQGQDAATPYAGLLEDIHGSFYGTTQAGGSEGFGTIFKASPTGHLESLHSFSLTDGANPVAALVLAANGSLYGATTQGGTGCPPSGCGAIFRLNPKFQITTIHSLAPPDGANPWAALIEASNGRFYGTTYSGGDAGANTYGTVFSITTGGVLTTLHSFNFMDGAYPYAGLVQAADGYLYGTTFGGGVQALGTSFKISPAGKFSTLHSFNAADGSNPYAALIQATDGNFYGTTYNGGAFGYGTVFSMTPVGAVTTLYSFGLLDGANPVGSLLQATDGNLYGTTNAGGAGGLGTVFELSLGLAPFVRTLPPAAPAGAVVDILGTNLTGATLVSFNGVPAAFTVVSPALISTNVPAGAVTGQVQVITPAGTLSSDVPFRVTLSGPRTNP